MKQYTRHALGAITLAVLTLSGCDGGASYDTPGNPRPVETNATRMIGTWRLRSMAEPDGTVHTCPATTPLLSCANADTQITIKDDGSLIDATGVTRPYTYQGDRLTYFGLPDTTTILATATANLMQWDATGAGGEAISVLFDKL